MKEDKGPNAPDGLKRSKAYFVTGYIFLLAMALFWSVDPSIRYILFGISAFFLFLGFHTRPRSVNFVRDFSTPRTEKTPEGSFPLFGELKYQFRKQPARPKPSEQKFENLSAAGRRHLVGLVFVAFFVVVTLFVVGSLFSSGSDYDQATFYYETGEQNYLNQEYDSAFINYRRAWKLNPDYAEAMLGYGNVLTIREQDDSALLMFNKALEILPEYKEASYSKSLLYYNQQKYDESLAILLPVLNEEPDYYDAMLLIGDCYYAQKKFDEAINWYGNAYENGGARSRALCHIMAYIHDTKGNYAEAIPLYKEALSYDSSVVEIYQRLGELLQNEEGNYYRTQAVKMRQK